MFKQISIVGFGLIGSSMARAIKAKGLTETLVAVDISPEACKTIEDLKLADRTTTNFGQGVEGSDLVILAMPVGATKLVCEAIAKNLDDGAIVSDVGSVKETVLNTMHEILPDHVDFVPAHPIAGTENSGPASGFAELFEDRWCILTPAQDTPVASVEKVSALWQAFGSRIEIMEARHHDLILGITSHLPHMIAYTIVGTANSLEDDIKSEVIQYSASGFRDFTRIAASDPTMWRDIFLNNKEAVLDVLQRFKQDLGEMERAIEEDDGDALFDSFSRIRAIKRQIMQDH